MGRGSAQHLCGSRLVSSSFATSAGAASSSGGGAVEPPYYTVRQRIQDEMYRTAAEAEAEAAVVDAVVQA